MTYPRPLTVARLCRSHQGYLNDVAVFGNERLGSTDIAEKSLIRLACTFAEKAGHVVRTVKRHEREVPCARGTNHRVLHRVLGSTDQ
jgi:hypothetical protein